VNSTIYVHVISSSKGSQTCQQQLKSIVFGAATASFSVLSCDEYKHLRSNHQYPESAFFTD
jgi:hypothetical protein